MTTECYVLGCSNPSTTARVQTPVKSLQLTFATLLCDKHAKMFSTTRPERFIHTTLEEYEVLKIKAAL